MIDKICMFLTNRIRKEMPDIDDEKAEIINYGLQNIIGEIPKTFLVLMIAYFLGIWKETLMTFLLMIPYKSASGGFHLKTQIYHIKRNMEIYFNNYDMDFWNDND